MAGIFPSRLPLHPAIGDGFREVPSVSPVHVTHPLRAWVWLAWNNRSKLPPGFLFAFLWP